MRAKDEIAKIVETKNGDILQTQQLGGRIELSVFDNNDRIAVGYLTHTEVRELIELLEEAF